MYMHITTNPLKMTMSAYHTIKKLGHNIVLKEIRHLTGMTHCASSSGMEQFGSGSRGTVNCLNLPLSLRFKGSAVTITVFKYRKNR
jgi:hypothetical protein